MDSITFARSVGNQVSDARRKAHMTQKQLAALAGISERLVRSIECGEARGIGLDKLLSVLAQLGLGLELCESPHAENGDSRDSAYDDLLHKAAVSWGYGE